MAIVDLGIINQGLLPAIAADWPGEWLGVSGFWWHWLFFSVVIIVFVLMMVMGVIYVERRGMGRMQSRLGPMRVGAWHHPFVRWNPEQVAPDERPFRIVMPGESAGG